MEQRVQGFLEEGKFRKARDEAKLLRKVDPARGLPLLIRANVGLARDMIAKGQISEAQQVLAYLATIAPPAEVRAIQTELSGNTGDLAPAAESAFQLLATSATALPEAERIRTADLVVLAFEEPRVNDPGAASLTSELRAIHSALRALGAQQYAAVQDALRPLPQRSVFSHWKVFLKGLVAFHQDDALRARRCLGELPPDTVPARAAEPYLLLLERNGSPRAAKPPSPRTVEGLCLLLGQPALGRPLARAEQAWRQGKSGESYRAIREGVSGFPSERPDLLGVLATFYFNALFTAPEALQQDLSRCFNSLLERRRPGDALERALIFRAVALYDHDEADPYELQLDWQGFLEAYEQAHGHNPRLASLTFAFLGRELSRPRSSFGFPLFHRQPAMLDAAGAARALERSVALDPKNLDAALRLCDVYEALRRTREHNRLLDDMVERFPDNKGVLLRAGRRCLDRKAFTKGLGYLARARQLDLLDPTLARESLRALFGLAGEQFKKQRPEAARAALDQTLTFAVDQTTNLTCARWCLLARRAATEEEFGDPHRVSELLAAAEPVAPSGEALLLYAHLAVMHSRGSVYDPESRFSGQFLGTALKSATVARALPLVRLGAFWTEAWAKDTPVAADESLLRKYLRAARKNPFTEHDVRQLAELCGPQGRCSGEVGDLVRSILKRDPAHPWFRLYLLTTQPFGLDPSPKTRRELQAIVEEANRRGDADTAQQARQWLGRRPPPLPPLPLPPPAAWDDEEFEDAPAENRESRRAPDRTPNPPPPEPENGFDTTDARMVQELAEEIRMLPEGQLRRLRKQLVNKGLPGFLFDMLAEAAREGGPLPKLPPIPKPPNRTRQTPDPNQLDLF